MSRALSLLCAAAAVLACSCAGARVRREVDALAGVIEAARARGAEACAPVELAMAEAHREFAALELDEGDYYRARDELAVADHSAREALRRSPERRCVLVEAGADRDRDGVPDERDECLDAPEDRDGFEDGDGCPEADNDNDGLADASDGCADQAEDRDGFADDDGCPDPDNDGDALADRVDECPDQAEDKDGRADDDGCPDCDDDGDGVPECPEARDQCPGQPGRAAGGCPYADVAVTEQRIEIRRPVEFVTGRASIRRPSHDLLEQVARALADHPALRIRIEGHTDSQGQARANLRLSRARAASVRRFLIRRGIDPARMVSEGYGEDRPVAENRTAAGRAQNRRVEFVITGR